MDYSERYVRLLSRLLCAASRLDGMYAAMVGVLWMQWWDRTHGGGLREGG